MKHLAIACAGAFATVAALAAPKAAPVADPFPYYVANCFNCHGTDGKGNSAIPPLAGRDKGVLEEALKAYKAGTKTATIMHQLAKGYSDQEIAVLADYFAKQH